MKFNKELNIARGIGIFLVVLGHSFPDETFNNIFLLKYTHKFIFSFHMSLFFFLSGFFAIKIYDICNLKEYKSFVIKKFRRLMVPYFVITLLAIPVKILMSKFALRPIGISKLIIDVFFYPWNNPIMFFWFIYTLFFIFILSSIFIKIPIKYMLLATFILSLIPFKYVGLFNISGILQYAVYFYLGMFIMRYYKDIIAIGNKKVIITISFIALIALNLLNIDDNQTSKVIFFVTSNIGIVMCITISYVLRDNYAGKIFNTLGDYSYDIFLFSWFFQCAARILFYQILKFDYNVVIIFMFISGFLPIVLSKYILNKSNILSELLLGKYKK